jgi:hypothetical protein
VSDEDVKKGVNQRISQILKNDSDFAAMQLRRIVMMARTNLPAFELSEIEQIVTALGGVNLRPLDQMPWDEMPFLIARRISDSELATHISSFEPFLLLVCAELASINRSYPHSLKDDAFFPLSGRDQI